MNGFDGLGMGLGNLARLSSARTRSISAENVTGEKGRGGMATEGTAAVVRAGSGNVLTLTEFRTDAGPDLFVYVVPSGATDAVEGGVRLGSLKGNIGNQQYALPAGLELDGASVVIWCRAFSVAFGAAQLSAA